MISLPRFFVLYALFGPVVTAFAQAPAGAPATAPAGGNLVKNGDFAKFTAQDNLWDGVDSAGFIAGSRGSIYAVTESGRLDNLAMPISVNFVDLNGDKLPDLVTADPGGILRVHFNSGTQTEPKFTYGEVIPLFPPQIAKDNKFEYRYWTNPHAIPKLSTFDWNRRGTLDMIFGNYGGDILLVPNAGSAQAPRYAQPTNYTKVKVETSNKRPWGNLFAPYAVDWNKDGKTDLLVGEGSYSANAVFVLLNQSSSNEPKFVEEQRFFLCYGDGREQLVPTVADYNGDDLPDVLVGDRLGTVGVFLNKSSWKPGDELPLASNVKFGTVEKVGDRQNPGIAPYAADYNGDGLFDILIGKTNGRVSVAINKGTKGQPKFDAPTDIKGVDTITEKINIPANFTMDAGNNRGNIYGYFSVAPDVVSPNGGKVLRAGYYPSPNKIFKLESISVDGRDKNDWTDYFHYWKEEWEHRHVHWAGYGRPTDFFAIRQELGALKVGTTYSLSFKVKGVGIDGGLCTLAYLGAAENVPTKFKRGERGSVKADKNEANEKILVTEAFSGGGAWKTVEKTFVVGFKDKDVRKISDTTLASLEFKFTLPQYAATCEIADVQLVAKAAR